MEKILGDIITENDVQRLCRLYELHPKQVKVLKERKRCVYEITYNNREYILKVFNAQERSKGEIQGEIDFVYACLSEGIQTYNPLMSKNRAALEQIKLESGQRVFAFAYEKVEGYEVEEDADAYKEFTAEMLESWGKLLGRLHAVSGKFAEQKRLFSRPIWYEVNDLDYKKYIPEDDKEIGSIFDNIIKQIKAIPKSDKNYGLVHGDLHYGNFLITSSGLAVLDFDSSSYYYYGADIAIALYSLLPYPRYRRKERRVFAEFFFEYFIKGYLSVFPLPNKELKNIPLFLKCEDMANYIALYRHWDMDNLAKNQKRILKRNRYHIVNEISLY